MSHTDINPSAPSQSLAEKKKSFFLGNFIVTLVFMLEFFFFFFFFFFSQLIELFHRTIQKKIENPTKYELFLPKPLTLF